MNGEPPPLWLPREPTKLVLVLDQVRQLPAFTVVSAASGPSVPERFEIVTPVDGLSSICFAPPVASAQLFGPMRYAPQSISEPNAMPGAPTVPSPCETMPVTANVEDSVVAPDTPKVPLTLIAPALTRNRCAPPAATAH